MIRVTIEMCPGGNEEAPRHLGTARITLRGIQRGNLGNYGCTLSRWGRPNLKWKSGAVLGFDRRRRGPWDLLLAALAACLSERPQETAHVIPFNEAVAEALENEAAQPILAEDVGDSL